MSKKIVLTLSGGADSTTVLYLAASKEDIKEINTISFDYGQRHRRELSCIDFHIQEASHKYNKKITNKIIDVSFIKCISPTSSLTNIEISNPKIKEMAGDAQPISYVPFRNNIFVSIAAGYAESTLSNEIWYGSAQADSLAGYWDSSNEWLESINSLLSLNRKSKIHLVTPLLTLGKEEIVKLGVTLGVDFSNTWTCYSNREDGLADAETPSSSLRLKGFINAGYRDPIVYVQQEKINEIYDKKGCKFIKLDTPIQ